MDLSDYSYDLPENLIAQSPAKPRDSCRLMVVKAGQNNNNKSKPDIEHKIFTDIVDYFSSGDVLVLNDTKVLHSKLLGKKESGSPAQITLLRNVSDPKNKEKKNLFEAKIKTKNPDVGTVFILHGSKARIISRKNIDTFIMQLDNLKPLDDAILPVPPYIRHNLSDKEYQTVFSKEKKDKGSLAAPTAGLHFTKRLLKKIESKGVKIAYITLHVSYGTFKNIEDVSTYVMDPEYYEISDQAAKTINNRKGKLFVCGTTTLKTLETTSKNGKIIAGKGESRMFIYPPFKFNSGTDALITNFHLPRSTLLLLTCAFGGLYSIIGSYKEAVKWKYRFYSLGDCMMIIR